MTEEEIKLTLYSAALTGVIANGSLGFSRGGDIACEADCLYRHAYARWLDDIKPKTQPEE